MNSESVLPQPMTNGSTTLAPIDSGMNSHLAKDMFLVVVYSTLYGRRLKGLLDRALALVLVILLSPLMVAIAVLVWFTMGSPILFRQQRIGRGDRPFLVYKFRTMRQDRRQQEILVNFPDRRITHKSESDPRHTKCGRFLRCFSLDELPQLVNVVRGEMSLVGPRPELTEVAHRTGLIGHPRNLARPGITGPWQVSDSRSTLIVHGLSHDLKYVQRITFRNDVAILLRTWGAIRRRTGS